jgi:beta-galactosidase
LISRNLAKENPEQEVLLAADILRSGKNVLAIVATPQRDGNRAGQSQSSPGLIRMAVPPPAWQRSLFNGLAQVIVQSTGEPGEIKLIAKSAGLTDGTLQITSQKATLRPAVR